MDFMSNLHSDSGKLEQIVSQFFLKALHIVLDSRIPSLHLRGGRYGDRSSLAGQVRKSDKWFNLVLGDRPASLEKLHSWRRNVMDSMIVDIILVHPPPTATSIDSLNDVANARASVETVIERWVVQYESPLVMAPQSGETFNFYQKIYKKLIILLRSLYLQLRLLPAYRISRQLTSSSSRSGVDLVYKVSSFGDPFNKSEVVMMKEYRLAPVDVPPGRLCVSVTYRPGLSDFNIGASITLPPKIITDYVGSPSTDPMRFFRTPDRGVHATSFPVRAPLPPLSGSSERPHSWTSGFHKPAHFVQNQSLGGTLPFHRVPSKAYESRPSHTDTRGDNYELSPPISLPASPSTPRYISGGNNMLTHGQSGTAPVTIPSRMVSDRYVSPNFSDPSKISLPPLSPKSTKFYPSSQESASGIALYKKTDRQRSGESPSALINQYSGHKVLKDNKDDSGRFSGLLSSSGSPRFGFSRSPSRLSSQDDLDELDFSCPFDFDDVDGAGTQASHNLDRRKASNLSSQPLPIGKKSQDAAVGVLVQMLRTAPPLRQDSSCYMSQSSNAVAQGGGGSESGLSMSRSTIDALEELRSYKDMKDLLLSKSGTRVPREEAG